MMGTSRDNACLKAFGVVVVLVENLQIEKAPIFLGLLFVVVNGLFKEAGEITATFSGDEAIPVLRQRRIND